MADFISALEAAPLIKDQITQEIIKGAIEESTALRMFKRLPNMSSRRLSQPVLDMLPIAYWVNADTGFKQITNVAWDNKVIKAEEIAVIVPIPDSVVDDAKGSGYDIWAEITPLIKQSFGVVIDGAVFFGIEKPINFRSSVVDTAIAAGNAVESTDDLYQDILGRDGTVGKVEQSGYIPNNHLADVTIRAGLRGLTDANGRPLWMDNLRQSNSYMLDGIPVVNMLNGAWDSSKAQLITGDFSQAVYSIRQDITFKMLTEGVIQNPNTKEIVYNLAQQDMSALRVVMRLGWEIPNPINALKPDKTERCPFAVLKPEDTP